MLPTSGKKPKDLLLMSRLKIILILLFCVIIIALAILYRSGFLTKANKYELIGYYPHENGIAFKGKDVKSEGAKIGFVGRVAPTPKGSFLYFCIDLKLLIPKGAHFHEVAGYKEENYINIIKEKTKENCQPGDTIAYFDATKELRGKWKIEEEARKRQISEQWQWARDFIKGLQKWQKELQ